MHFCQFCPLLTRCLVDTSPFLTPRPDPSGRRPRQKPDERIDIRRLAAVGRGRYLTSSGRLRTLGGETGIHWGDRTLGVRDDRPRGRRSGVDGLRSHDRAGEPGHRKCEEQTVRGARSGEHKISFLNVLSLLSPLSSMCILEKKNAAVLGSGANML